MFTHQYRYLFILLLSLFTFLNTVLCNVYHYFGIDIEWQYALLTILLVTFFTWEASRLLEPFIQKKISPQKHKIRFLVVFFIAAATLSSILAAGAVYLVGGVLHGYNWQQNSNPLKLNIIYSGLVCLLFHLLNTILFFFREYKRQWMEAEELRRFSSQAELQLVRSQINPHFLFNNLNVLSGMVIKDNPEANKFIEEFSKVYRYILKNQDKELIELRSELDFIQPYIFLLKKRFDEGLSFSINIADQYKAWHMVPAALQMLIENAIKHNIVSRSKPLHIDIHTNGNQTLVIKNNLQPRTTTDSSTRIGLQNISRRYELICGKNVLIKQTAESFEVSLPLINMN
jgi:two-component system, LytTR family, sensor kinase